MVGLTPIKVRFFKMSMKGVAFIFNGLDYQWVDPMVEFHTFHSGSMSNETLGDPDSNYKVNKKKIKH